MSLTLPSRHTGTVVIYTYQFLLLSALDGGEWPMSCPAALTQEDAPVPTTAGIQ